MTDPLRDRASPSPCSALAALPRCAATAADRDRDLQNDMDSAAQRSRSGEAPGGNCMRGGSQQGAEGRRSASAPASAARTPVIGRNLEIARDRAPARAATPKAKRKRTFVAVELRDGAGGQYQLAVFPGSAPSSCAATCSRTARILLKAKATDEADQRLGKANKLRLQAFNITSGPDKGGCRVHRLRQRQACGRCSPTAHRPQPLDGRVHGLSVGSAQAAGGRRRASTTSRSRVPDPF